MNPATFGRGCMVLAGLAILGCGSGEQRNAESNGNLNGTALPANNPPALAMPADDFSSMKDTSHRESSGKAPVMGEGRIWTAKRILFRLPDGWKLETPSSAMRLAEIRASERVVIPVFHFGGDAGGVQANIERWKGQMTRMDASRIDSMRVDGLRVHLVVLDGRFQSNMTPQGPAARTQIEEDATLLGAIVEGGEGPVFLKAVGSRRDILQIRAEFEKMIKGVQVACGQD